MVKIKKITKYILYIISLFLISYYFLSNGLSDFIAYNINIIKNEKTNSTSIVLSNIKDFLLNKNKFETKIMNKSDIEKFMIDNRFNKSSIDVVIKTGLNVKLFKYENNSSYYIPIINQINLFGLKNFDNIAGNERNVLVHELIHVIIHNDLIKQKIIEKNLINSIKKENDVINFILNKNFNSFNKNEKDKKLYIDLYNKQRYSILGSVGVLLPPSTYNNKPLKQILKEFENNKINLETNNGMLQEIITFRFGETNSNLRKKISNNSIEAKNICNTIFNDCE